jgi:hypothetical protein
VSPVKYELGFYIPEDAILHSHSRGNLKSYIILKGFNDEIFLRMLYCGVLGRVTLVKNRCFGGTFCLHH